MNRILKNEMERGRKMTDLVEGNTKSRLFRFMLPLLAGNFLQQCYSFVDGVIVGQVVGKMD